MGDSDDGWAVFGSRPGSSASNYPPDSPADEHDGFSLATQPNAAGNKTFTKPNKYNPRGKSPSPEPWRGAGVSSRSSTPHGTHGSHGQNYFLSKAKSSSNNNPNKSYVDDTLFTSQRQNSGEEWEAPWNAQSNGSRPATPTRRTARSPSPRAQSPGPKTRNYYGKVWNKRNQSFADESLFGAKPDDPEFKAPWDKNKKQTYVFDATDYKALEIKKQLQNAAKNSRNKSNKGPTKVENSERADHIERALQSQLAVQGEKPRPKSRGGDSSHGPSTPKRAPKFKESYVDELLFGSKPQEPGFPAPWEDNKKRTIHAFDGTNSTVTINHENGRSVESRPGSRTGSRRGSTGSVTTLRPAWK